MSDSSLPEAAQQSSAAASPEPLQTDTSASAARKAQLKRRVAQAIANKPKLQAIAWVIVTLAFATILPVTYLSWWIGIPHLFAWPGANFLLWIPAAFGILMLACVPIWTTMLAYSALQYVSDLSLAIEEESLRKVQSRVQETEMEAIRRFENTDNAGLLPLLTYSRAQLDAYYHIGLNQTRRSFFHGIVAMWLGFALLLTGLALYIIPLNNFGLLSPSQDFKILVLSGAVMIEFISALFLWMYKSTTAQLIYLYDRQMFNHTSILAFRMASTIANEKGDETRSIIVKRLIDWKPGLEQLQLPRSAELSALVSKQTSGKSAE